MPEKGRVILVGAGPGDPGLLTLAAKTAMESADVILYDRLVGEEILAMMPTAAVKIDVGKNKGSHPVPQDEINRLIVTYALSGKTVVRLKGGDPFLFGRGAEELEQVARGNIPFQVVPGVTSAIAGPAYAGIPVTHRDHSSSLHIFTGHGKNGTPPDIPYKELAILRGTLVFLMGLSAVEDICHGLSAAGMPAETYAALVENGTRDNQRRITGTLDSLPDLARRKTVTSPALLIVGAVCDLAETFDWFTRPRLHGKNILVVSSQATGSRLAVHLRSRSCAVDELAGITTEPLPAPDSFWRTLGRYRWIVFTSPVGAELFFNGLPQRGVDIRSLAGARFAVIGKRTGKVLSDRGIISDFRPAQYNGRALGEGLVTLVKPGDRVLLFRAETGDGNLPRVLKENNVDFDDHAAYRTFRNALPDAIRERVKAGGYDALTFTSASSVETLAEAMSDCSALPRTFCIGEMTATAARRHGMQAEVSDAATIESLADLILERMGQA